MKRVKEKTLIMAGASVPLGPKYRSVRDDKFYRVITVGTPLDMGVEEECVIYREETDFFNSSVFISKRSDFERNFVRV